MYIQYYTIHGETNTHINKTLVETEEGVSDTVTIATDELEVHEQVEESDADVALCMCVCVCVEARRNF